MNELLTDYVEEQEDGNRALEVLRRNEPTISLEEVERKLGLAD